MKTIADHVERALDDALSMTFPASDPVAVFMPVPAEMQIERCPALTAHPRMARPKVSPLRNGMDHF